jgi:hypothetical protein
MHRQRIYNPAQLTPEEREAYFAVRFEELDTLLGLLKKHKLGEPCQNAILLGPRGMGKSTLGLRFLDIVAADEELSKLWQPIPFPEESYGVSSLGELWAMALQELSAQVGDQRWAERADELLKTERDDARLEENTYAVLNEYKKESGKTPLLFIENLNLIFDQFRNENDSYKFRERLAGKDDTFVLAGATHSFDALDNPDEPLFEFLRPIELRPLNAEGCLALIKGTMRDHTDNETKNTIEESRGRIEAIRTLTGGSPRLIALSWRLIQESPTGRARDDLERLIDEQTPYFQSQIERLAPQARKVFNAVAQLWSPALTKDIAETARLSTSQTSAQLSTLRKDGYVETTRLSNERRDRYQVVDRFYGIYFLLRFSRDKRKVVEGLVNFLFEAYGPYSIWRMLSETAKNISIDKQPEVRFSVDAMAIKTIENIESITAERVISGVTRENVSKVLVAFRVEESYESFLKETKILNDFIGFENQFLKIKKNSISNRSYSILPRYVFLIEFLFEKFTSLSESQKLIRTFFLAHIAEKYCGDDDFYMVFLILFTNETTGWLLEFTKILFTDDPNSFTDAFIEFKDGKSIDHHPPEIVSTVHHVANVRRTEVGDINAPEVAPAAADVARST